LRWWHFTRYVTPVALTRNSICDLSSSSLLRRRGIGGFGHPDLGLNRNRRTIQTDRIDLLKRRQTRDPGKRHPRSLIKVLIDVVEAKKAQI